MQLEIDRGQMEDLSIRFPVRVGRPLIDAHNLCSVTVCVASWLASSKSSN